MSAQATAVATFASSLCSRLCGSCANAVETAGGVQGTVGGVQGTAGGVQGTAGRVQGTAGGVQGTVGGVGGPSSWRALCWRRAHDVWLALASWCAESALKLAALRHSPTVINAIEASRGLGSRALAAALGRWDAGVSALGRLW